MWAGRRSPRENDSQRSPPEVPLFNSCNLKRQHAPAANMLRLILRGCKEVANREPEIQRHRNISY